MVKIAIIIPFFKINFFEKTLASLAQQIDKRFHVYIGDDASPNAPDELLKKYEGQFNYTYKRFNDNLGGVSLVKQWERCLAMMQDEEWFMILGDDDVLGEKVVEEFYKKKDRVEKLKINVIKYATVVIDDDDNQITKVFRNKEIMNSSDAFYHKMIDQSRSSLSEHIFRKTTFDKIGFRNYKYAWHTDDMAVLEFSNFGLLFSINDEIVYVRVSTQSISGGKDNNDIKCSISLEFYKDLINLNLKKINYKQKKILIRIYESALLKVNGISLKNLIHLSYLYMKNYIFLDVVRIWYKSFLAFQFFSYPTKKK